MTVFEVVWIYRDEEFLLAQHETEEAALSDLESGRSRCHLLIHGGALRLDEVGYGA